MSDNDDQTQATIAKTLWSETLIELLIVSLEKNLSDEKIVELLKDLKQKKFKPDYIVRKVSKSLGEKQANRVKLLLPKTLSR
ncbi:MAG: hypothetical protein HN764_04015 [Gammaproteobacteria bacterium]|jgi:hypothetical protein|nr:hypothetical protein [Gammaproteobacteria bacterium]